MELRDKVVVVTGAASGIGRAMARRFAEEGARGVVVADRDGPAVERLAAELGERARALTCNVAVEAENVGLIARTEDAFGPIDLFCANAGVGIGTDPIATTPNEWATAIGVNVMAHVHAAKHLLPGWLARGEGYFLTTASAAGLITQLGNAPYSVTKHAALGFAEWLACTYGDRGVRVSCLCPMGVNTAMLNAEAGAGISTAAGDVVRASGLVLEPEAVADIVVEALADERFLVLPHEDVLTFFQRKAGDYERWIHGMQRLRRRVGGE